MLNYFLFFIIIGFFVGLINSFIIISQNLYLKYGLFSLTFYHLIENINHWILIIILIAIGVFILWLFVCLFLKILKRMIAFSLKNKDTFILTFCLLFFCVVGWILNHYLIFYYRFHPFSILADLGLLIFTILLFLLLKNILNITIF